MKQTLIILVSILMLISLAIYAFISSDEKKSSPEPEKEKSLVDILPLEASKLMEQNQNNKNFLILDVRTAGELREGFIKESLNIDFYKPDFKKELSKLDRSKTYLIYCKSSRRTGKIKEMMGELKFKKVYNMSGGIMKWKADGLPLEK